MTSPWLTQALAEEHVRSLRSDATAARRAPRSVTGRTRHAAPARALAAVRGWFAPAAVGCEA